MKCHRPDLVLDDDLVGGGGGGNLVPDYFVLRYSRKSQLKCTLIQFALIFLPFSPLRDDTILIISLMSNKPKLMLVTI